MEYLTKDQRRRATEGDPMIALQNELRLNMPNGWCFNIKFFAQMTWLECNFA